MLTHSFTNQGDQILDVTIHVNMEDIFVHFGQHALIPRNECMF